MSSFLLSFLSTELTASKYVILILLTFFFINAFYYFYYETITSKFVNDTGDKYNNNKRSPLSKDKEYLKSKDILSSLFSGFAQNQILQKAKTAKQIYVVVASVSKNSCNFLLNHLFYILFLLVSTSELAFKQKFLTSNDTTSTTRRVIAKFLLFYMNFSNRSIHLKVDTRTLRSYICDILYKTRIEKIEKLSKFFTNTA
jgi:hypothetical protein